MTALRLFAIIGIFFCTMIGWFILGGTISSRTNDKSSVLGHSVEENWGGTHKQFNPKAYIYHSVDETYIDRSVNAAGQTIEQERTHKVERPKHIEFTQSKITTDLQVDYRQKGLLW